MSVCVVGEAPMSAPSTVKLGMSLWVSIRMADLVMAATCLSIFWLFAAKGVQASNSAGAARLKACVVKSTEYNQGR